MPQRCTPPVKTVETDVTTAGWDATNGLEKTLLDARADGDEPTYLAALARADLVLPTPPDADCLVAEVSGRRCVLAFTSEPAMRQVLGNGRQ